MTGYARTALRATAPWPSGPPREPEHDGRPPAGRREPVYECGRGHTFTRVLAADAQVPRTWDCSCGSPSVLRDAAGGVLALGTPGVAFPGYAHSGEWVAAPRGTGPMEQLLKRRTRKELDALLAERVAEVRALREAGVA